MAYFTYPSEIYKIAQKNWKKLSVIGMYKKYPKFLEKNIFDKIIDVVYHASFLTEESRRFWFRVIYSKPVEEYVPLFRPRNIIRFDYPRSFNVSEIVKLAPSADPTHVLIGISGENTDTLQIWGLIEVGSSWHDFLRHERDGASPPPNEFIFSSIKPGHLSISYGADTVLILDQGKISETSHVFREGPVADFFISGKTSLYNEVCENLKTNCFDKEGHDDDYPQRSYVFLLERILYRIRDSFHGGAIIMIPDSININDTRLKDRIIIKYPCHFDGLWNSIKDELIEHRKYFDLHFKLWDSESITNKEFTQYSILYSNYEEAKEKVTRAVQFISSLSAVDGAVVITDKLRLLGFGAEIIAISPSLHEIKIITDLKTYDGDNRNIDFFGTRHRSAFRFCSSFQDSIAFIVSQDGGIKIVKRVGSEVYLWPNIL